MWQEKDCFYIQLKRASEDLMRDYTEALAPSGITPVQHLILARIYKCQGASLREVAKSIGVDRSTLTRTIKPLLKAGFILNTKPKGTRNSRLMLTEQGERTFLLAHQLWNEQQDRIASRLGENGVNEFSSFLRRLTDK